LFHTQNIYRFASIEQRPKDIQLGNISSIKNALSNLTKYQNPYYWAAFQISSIN
jgi:CHAT domain-containing protein